MAMSLVGKTAIVTGAGSGPSKGFPFLLHFLTIRPGINLSFARALLGKHCNVVFADLALRPEAQELVSNHANTSRKPAKAVFQPTDVREWQQLERLFCIASEEFGGADMYVLWDSHVGIVEEQDIVREKRPLLAC